MPYSYGREIMKDWVIEALRTLGGQGDIVDICRIVWEQHEEDIRKSGELLYKWQYEIRWVGTLLRKEGRLLQASQSPKGIWELSE